MSGLEDWLPPTNEFFFGTNREPIPLRPVYKPTLFFIFKRYMARLWWAFTASQHDEWIGW